MARTRQGKAYTWQLDNTPIGSGDAGEVYAARCIEQPDPADKTSEGVAAAQPGEEEIQEVAASNPEPDEDASAEAQLSMDDLF